MHPQKKARRRRYCSACRHAPEACLCDSIEPLALETKVEILLHAREATKCTATGPLALRALSESRLHLVGQRDEVLDLSSLHEEGRRVLVLFPQEGAAELSREYLAGDARPVTLVVPDGTWRQSRRAAKRVSGLGEADVVCLGAGELDTFEALCRALGILESDQAQQDLLSLSQRVNDSHGVAEHPETSPDAPPDSSDSPPLQILFQDEFLIAINKPSGLLVHRGWANDSFPALQRLRDQIGERVYPVHRLDRATSGVLLFARSSEVARDLQALFESHAVVKRYWALCRGNQLKAQRLSHPLAKEKGGARSPAVTELRLLASFERYGLVEAIPRTGRTHQIRKHLKHVAHPIIGDVRYGKGEHNRLFRERFAFGRLALHCRSLELIHPRTKESLTIEAELPDDMASLFTALGFPQV